MKNAAKVGDGQVLCNCPKNRPKLLFPCVTIWLKKKGTLKCRIYSPVNLE